MGKYQQEAKELLGYVGGKDNIAAVSHCMTRMRFVLKSPELADMKKIESMQSVKGTFTQAGQFQVIIGNDVAAFYRDFIAETGLEMVTKEEVRQAARRNQNWLQRLVGALAEIFAPLIPAIITGGLILGFRNCIDSLYIFGDGSQTLVELSQFWAGVDSFLWLIGEAVFHMLPVGICWSVTKKMGTNQMLGIVLGLTLVSGQLLNAYSVGSTPADQIPKWDFGFLQVDMIGYQAQVIPAILAAFMLVLLERGIRAITPHVVQMIVVPFFSLLLAVIAAHFILGPIGWKIGAAISSFVYAGITGPFQVLFGAVFGFFYAPLVITGLHHMTNAIDLQLIADYDGTMLWPMIALSNIAQGSAVLAMIFLQRKNTNAQEVNVPACISCYMGVTEPAIFGVNLKYSFPFFCGMAGSMVAAIWSVAANATANAIGVGGLPGILSMQPQSMGSFLVSMLLAIAVPFLLTYLIGVRRLTAEERCGRGASPEAEGQAGSRRQRAGSAAEGQAGSRQQGTCLAAEGQAGSRRQRAGLEAVQRADAAEAGEAQQAFGQASGRKREKRGVLYAPVSGEVIPIAQVSDPVFAKKILGDGIGIKPAQELVVAPADGVLTGLMPDTRHAFGLLNDDGLELLVHVGIDTVTMGGKGFSYLAQEGDFVRAGQPVLRFCREDILASGREETVLMVVLQSPGLAVRFLEAPEANGTEGDAAQTEAPKTDRGDTHTETPKTDRGDTQTLGIVAVYEPEGGRQSHEH